MICPHCLETIDDDATVCPRCGGLTESHVRADFIFCEGCGARLSPHDRTCPKCGRPAPGILSTKASAADLAAGRTASFPKLTGPAVETERKPQAASAQSVLSDSLDPSATNVLNIGDAGQAGDDPYHGKRKLPRGVVAALCTLVLVAGAVVFVVYDPFLVMPGVYEWVATSAQEMFPSRQTAETPATDTGDGDAGEDDAADEGQIVSDAVLSDEEAYSRLDLIYERIMAFPDTDQFGAVIDDFNGGYLLRDKSRREDASTSAYALRDQVQQVIDELGDIKLADGSQYTDDVENLEQLAQWMFERVDVICQAWDISLGYPEGESMSQHQSEILAPIREAGSTAQEEFDAHASAWRPEAPA